MEKEPDRTTDSDQEKPAYRYDKALWIALGFVEFMLALRFSLKFIGLDYGSTLANLVYKITNPFVSPLLKAFGPYKEEGSIFEWATLLAMLIYWMIAWMVVRIFLTDNTVASPESEKDYK